MQEDIRDLLAPDAASLPGVHIREVSGGGVCLAGAHEMEVGSQHKMATLLDQVRAWLHATRTSAADERTMRRQPPCCR